MSLIGQDQDCTPSYSASNQPNEGSTFQVNLRTELLEMMDSSNILEMSETSKAVGTLLMDLTAPLSEEIESRSKSNEDGRPLENGRKEDRTVPYIDLHRISPEEMISNPEWFGKSTPAKTPERYMQVRNHIINMWDTLPEKVYLSKTRTRQGLVADVNVIGRLHGYLEAIGRINVGVKPTGPGNRYRRKTAGLSGGQNSRYARKDTPSWDVLEDGLDNRPRKRKVRDENGSWVDQDVPETRVMTHEILRARASRPRAELLIEYERERLDAKNATHTDFTEIEGLPKYRMASYYATSRKAKEMKENGAAYDPFRLVPPRIRTDSNSDAYKLHIQSNVLLVMDFHAHLAHTEVIGLLGGKYNPSAGIIQIEAIFPCRSLSTGVQCELDPVSEMRARDQFASQELAVVGWYRSHPTFAPHPTIRDVEIQAQYQLLFRRSEDGTEPFVSAIISPYDTTNPSEISRLSFTHVGRDVHPDDGYLIPEECERVIIPSEFTPDMPFRQLFDLVKEYRSYEHRVELEARYRKDEPLTRREKLLMSIRSNVAASDGDAQEFLIRVSDLLKEGFGGGKPSVSHSTFGIYHEHNPIQ